MATCDKCKANASFLWAINDGPALCTTCKEVTEREARANDPEEIARQKQIAAERAALHEQQRLRALRPEPAEAFCTYGECAGATNPAIGIRSGHLACEHCLRVDLPGHPEAPIVMLEKRVAALEAALQAQTTRGKGTKA